MCNLYDTTVIIIPYRDREDHLQRILPRFEKLFSDRDVRILVIEQLDTLPFNRGRLLNLGFHTAKGLSNWVCFHDVDLVPVSGGELYSPPVGAAHLAGRAEQYDYQMPYQGYIGGVFAITRRAFIAIDGFASEYWGWGREDDDLLLRLWVKNIPIEYRVGRFSSLPHNRQEASAASIALFLSALKSRRNYATSVEQREWIDRKIRWIVNVYGSPDAGAGSEAGGLSTTSAALISRRTLFRRRPSNSRKASFRCEVYSYDLSSPSTALNCANDSESHAADMNSSDGA